jgi:hypothetical protein
MPAPAERFAEEEGCLRKRLLDVFAVCDRKELMVAIVDAFALVLQQGHELQTVQFSSL